MSTPIELVNTFNNISMELKACLTDIHYQKGYTRVEYAHIHDCCEIYINVRGNVSFLVENTLYPLKTGDVILTMPNEIHHCIYNEDCVHGHFCLWIKVTGDSGNMLSLVTDRKKGEGNHISLTPQDREKALELCTRLSDGFKDGKVKDVGFQADLYTLLALISGYSPTQGTSKALTETFEEILKYIDQNLCDNINGDTIAKKFFISRSTLYRQFKTGLGITPSKYIEAKRLSLAKEMIKKGCSIQEACSASGYNDYSHFIAIFKKKFNTTPYKYKKML